MPIYPFINIHIFLVFSEYGLLSNNDGSPIQGVRYTADSNINPRLIYDALLKFLSLWDGNDNIRTTTDNNVICDI